MNRALLDAVTVVEREERYEVLLATISNTGLSEQVRWDAYQQALDINLQREIEESKGLDS